MACLDAVECVSRFAHAVGRALVARDPLHLTLEFHKVDRAGRILLDTGRNDYSATLAAAYAVRARPGAPVSAPCAWAALEQGTVSPRSFTLRSMMRHLPDLDDPWRDMRPTSLHHAIEALRRIATRPDAADSADAGIS
jgi:bifunctional non-homologous end joining protein LigD